MKHNPTRPDTLVIYYKKTPSNLLPETFRNCKNPEKILRNRNLPQVQKVNYGGKSYDFSKLLNVYSKVK